MKSVKRASLQMSISTIVVLILSMTLLGFGLMFIRTTFTKATSQFTSVNAQVKQNLLDMLKDGTSRIAVQDTQPTIKEGQSYSDYIALKNVLGKPYTFYVLGDGNITATGNWSYGTISQRTNPAAFSTVQCYADDNGDSLDDVKKAVTFKTLKARTIRSGSTIVAKLLISVSPTAPTGTYYCSIIISDPSVGTGGTPQIYASKEIDVTVSS